MKMSKEPIYILPPLGSRKFLSSKYLSQDFPTVFDFIDQQGRKPVAINSLSPLAWVAAGNGTYFLRVVGGRFAKIARVGQENPR
jgi:hypothetical protein